jgi:hypothetical protein
MNVTYTDKAKQGREGFTRLQGATNRLEEVVGPSSGRVKVEWDRTEDEKGQPRYNLRISDEVGSASTSFAPDELVPSSSLLFRLTRVWDEVLRVRVHKYLDDLQKRDGSES